MYGIFCLFNMKLLVFSLLISLPVTWQLGVGVRSSMSLENSEAAIDSESHSADEEQRGLFNFNILNALSDTSGGCNDALSYVKIDGTVYYFSSPFATSTWRDAKQFCNTNGMKLAKIENEATSAAMINYIIYLFIFEGQEEVNKPWWIGLHEGLLGKYYWENRYRQVERASLNNMEIDNTANTAALDCGAWIPELTIRSCRLTSPFICELVDFCVGKVTPRVFPDDFNIPN